MLVGGVTRSGGPPFVAVMRTAHLRQRHDSTRIGARHRLWLRRLLVRSQVGATPMVVAEVVLEHAAEPVAVQWRTSDLAPTLAGWL